MPLETKKYLYDVQRAANLLKDFTAGKTFDDYIQDAMLRAAVEREAASPLLAIARRSIGMAIT